MTDSRNNGEKTGKSIPPVEHQFKPGNPGRPKGSRNKLGEDFIRALHEDFVEHGAAAIVEVRETKPDAYLKVIAQILPAQLNVNVTRELTDSELDQQIRILAAALNLEVGIGGTSPGEAEADASQPAGDIPALH